MRLVALSIVLPLVVGVTACVAPGAESLDPGSAPDDAVAVEATAASPEITEKANAIVNAIEGLMKLNRQWNLRLRDGLKTEEAKRESQEMVQKMRDTLATLPADADWVTHYVEENREAIKAGFARELASEEMQKAIGAEKIQKLIDAVNKLGGVDAIILKLAAILHEHAHDASEQLAQGKKMQVAVLCGMAGTIAGANAARGTYRNVIPPVVASLMLGCVR